MRNHQAYVCVFFLLIVCTPVHAEEATGMCRTPAEPEVIRCEASSGSLCVDTPLGSVVGQSVVITGKIDPEVWEASALSLTIQHEYTHRLATVPTDHPRSNCDEPLTIQEPLCLEEDGVFAARFPLFEEGPHTILVTAGGGGSGATQQVIKTSRVKPLTISADDVHHEEANHVSTVTVSLLDDCSFCDVIGASTHGVTVTVTNVIREANAAERSIACVTTTEEGGAGTFTVGVPLVPGENHLTVTACNAATEGNCPAVRDIVVREGGERRSLEILTPPPAPAYESSATTTIPFSFRMSGSDPGACVDVIINRLLPEEVCSDASGVYRKTITPQVGINVVTVKREGIEFPWAFGWGHIETTSVGTAGIVLPARTATDVLQPLLSNFLRSDEFGEMVERVMDDRSVIARSEATRQSPSPPPFPFCQSGGMGQDFIIGIRGVPAIGEARMEGMAFTDNRWSFTMNADEVEAGINLFKDENHDGQPDGEPLPLTIGFKKMLADLVIQVESDKILLTSPHTDCDYKSAAYCQGFPAPLIPANFMGNAGRLGHFVACDVDEVSPDLEDVCRALNTVNAQTGIISEKVLDAINTTLVCKGSAALTAMMREGIDDVSIDARGIGVAANLPLDVDGQPAGVGVISDPSAPTVTSLDLVSRDGHLLDVSLTSSFVNGLLFTMTQQGKADIDFSEEIIKEKFGFDFVKQCDEAEEAHTLCNVRPRVGELLGTALTTYGYYPAKQPLLMQIHGNRALTPRISIAKPEELPVVTEATMETEEETSVVPPSGTLFDIQVGGLEMTFLTLPEKQPIITFDLSLLLALEVSGPVADSNDPTRAVLVVRPLADRSRLSLVALDATNATTVPSESLVATLRDKLRLALSGYAQPEKAIRIPIPKQVDLADLIDDDSLVSLFGVKELALAPEGLSLTTDPVRELMVLGLNGWFTQVLHEAGTEISFQLPH
ncbi:MAG: hypothetical protein HY465_00090 [Deltaproteobacteria bacterium]|nr:hypothetical protein [Deltaproteobacteria bacterium]